VMADVSGQTADQECKNAWIVSWRFYIKVIYYKSLINPRSQVTIGS
jgi:hypothetical protein